MENNKVVPMQAKNAVALWGSALVGQRVWTPQVGVYPGGWTTVSAEQPEADAADISFFVDDVEYPGEVMGVLENEVCLVAYPW